MLITRETSAFEIDDDNAPIHPGKGARALNGLRGPFADGLKPAIGDAHLFDKEIFDGVGAVF